MAGTTQRLARLAADAGGVLLGWIGLLVFENVLVGVWQRDQFAGSWEMGMARKLLTPIALAALLPCAPAAAGLLRLSEWAAVDGRARGGLVGLAGLGGGALAYGISFGRHLVMPFVRIPFVVTLAGASAIAAGVIVPRLVRLAHRAPRALAAVAAVAALALWFGDLFVLPRLYPAFHLALFASMLVMVAAISRAARARRTGSRLGLVPIALGLASIAWAPFAAERVRGADNLRLVLSEHAPLLGRAVRVAAWLAEPPPLDGAPPEALTSAGDVPRALDWSGHDVLLLSVDALRADHVSSYGYARTTTPNLDALAREGALFENAYCPTPHTSYSITSMMTGKYDAPPPLAGARRWTRRRGRRRSGGTATGPQLSTRPPSSSSTKIGFATSKPAGSTSSTARSSSRPPTSARDQVRAYLTGASALPIFLWVHLFEPHEPYEMHPDHPFAPRRATTGTPRRRVRQRDRRGGRRHRLDRRPLPQRETRHGRHRDRRPRRGVRRARRALPRDELSTRSKCACRWSSSGPGSLPGRISTAVQTIDLLPTTLSALGIPRPARVRGRDLGPMLAHRPGDGSRDTDDAGLAYAETDEYTLLARGEDRLVCARKIGACALYDVARDRSELHDRSGEAPERVARLRLETAKIERDQGRFEGEGGAMWPEALRRGLEGDVDAAEDVGALLDDAKVTIRRKAAEVLFRLHAPGSVPGLSRALMRDEDDEVRRWCALALVRSGESPSPTADALLADRSVEWRRRAALAFAERGDGRGAGELAEWWKEQAPPNKGLDVEDGKELLAAMARVRDTAAVPALLATLEFVPLRPWIAETLGAIGDVRARGPLLLALREERYVTARPVEARALLSLGARSELLAPLTRFAGVPDPMVEAVGVLHEAHLLERTSGGVSLAIAEETLAATVNVPLGPPLRLLVLASKGGGTLSGTAGGASLVEARFLGAVHVVELGPASARDLRLDLRETMGLLAAWVVPLATDVPPPAPDPRDLAAGAGEIDAGRPGPHN